MAGLLVFNLPSAICTSELEEIFGVYGRVVCTEIERVGESECTRASAVVTFLTKKDKKNALRDRYHLRFEYNIVVKNLNSLTVDDTTVFLKKINPTRPECQAEVRGIPSSWTWMQLKDACTCKEAECCFADITQDGRGVVGFYYRADMQSAVEVFNAKTKTGVRLIANE